MKTSIKYVLAAIGMVQVILFVALMLIYVLPAFRGGIYEEKEMMTREMINVSLGIIEHYYDMFEEGSLSEYEAQTKAKETIRAMRFGPDELDYFWINDYDHVMLMHPASPHLEGMDMFDTQDPEGFYLIREFVRVCREQGGGYVPYVWDYYGDADRLEPKLSYVAGFEPWQWIIGTGVYINDVNEAVAATRNHLLLWTVLFAALSFGLFIHISERFKLSQKFEQMAKALTKSQEQFQAILSFLPDATFAIDLEGKVILWNKALEEMTGIRSEEIMGKGDYEYAIPFYGYKRPALANLVMDPDPDIEEKYTGIVRSKDNSLIAEAFCPFIGEAGMYIWGKATPLYDSQGNITGVIEAVRDITQRKHTEKELQESEKRAKRQRAAIVELVLDQTVVAAEMPAALQRINEVVAAALNVERASIWLISDDRTELRCLSLYEGEKGEHSAGAVLKTTLFPRYFEAIYTGSIINACNAQKDERTSELTAGYLAPLGITSMLDAGIQAEGVLMGVLCLEHMGEIRKWHFDEEAFVNTTASMVAQLFSNLKRKQAEEAFRDANRRLDEIIDFLPDATLVIDINGRVIAWNKAMEEMTLVKKEEIMGKGDYEYALPFYGERRPIMINLALLPAAEYEKLKQNYESISWNGDSLLGEGFCPHTYGGKGAYLLGSASLLRDASGRIVGAIESIRDITDRKHTEQKISDYNMELEELYSQLDNEIQKAARIHERTLPADLPSIQGLFLAAHYQPARKMGGDFYDLVTAGNKLVLYLSDVAGHGIEGAMLSVFIKEAITSYLSLKQDEIEPGKILRYLDSQYRRQNYPDDYFICIFLAVLDLETKELSFTGAGFQNSPLLHQGNKDKLELGDSDLPIMLSLPRDMLDFHVTSITLLPGSTLLFTTDGLPEQISAGQCYDDRLAKIFYDNTFLPPEAIVELINDDFQQFNNGTLQGEDDITFLVMQLDAEDQKKKHQLQLESDLKVLDWLHVHVSPLIHDFGEKETLINILHEMVANAIEHGNKFDPSKKVSLEIATAGSFIYAAVEDEGEGHNWKEKINAAMDYGGSEFRGRGIIMSRLLSERLFYNTKGNKAFIIMRGDDVHASGTA